MLLLPSAYMAMFSDPDTYWHIAAGDLIRNLGALPEFNPWSLLAPSQRWYNIAWLWDIGASGLYQHFGWSGIIAANSIIIAAALALIFANALLLSRDGFSAILATLLFSSTLCHLTLRPLQFSVLFMAALLLLLTHVHHGRIKKHWLWLIPPLMALWVNLHGGFVIGFLLMGLFTLAALLKKHRDLTVTLTIIGTASLLASLLNPYGIHIIDAVTLTLGSHTASIIQEWKPLSVTLSNLPALGMLGLFVVLLAFKRIKLTQIECWVACLWMALGLMSVRNMPLFGIAVTPLLAVAFQRLLKPTSPSKPVLPWVQRVSNFLSHLTHQPRASCAMIALSLASALWLFSDSADHLYGTSQLNPVPDLSAELSYIKRQHPPLRLLNTYNLGGPLIFASHGTLPVWIDGRAETAYPAHIITDYIAFHDKTTGWEELFNRHKLDGVIIPNHDVEYQTRFSDPKIWHLAFKGQTATIYTKNK